LQTFGCPDRCAGEDAWFLESYCCFFIDEHWISSLGQK
jgi:hypothetical protein